LLIFYAKSGKNLCSPENFRFDFINSYMSGSPPKMLLSKGGTKSRSNCERTYWLRVVISFWIKTYWHNFSAIVVSTLAEHTYWRGESKTVFTYFL